MRARSPGREPVQRRQRGGALPRFPRPRGGRANGPRQPKSLAGHEESSIKARRIVELTAESERVVKSGTRRMLEAEGNGSDFLFEFVSFPFCSVPDNEVTVIQKGLQMAVGGPVKMHS